MALSAHLDRDDRLSVRRDGLYLEEHALADLARRFGTPLHVVSQERLQLRARELVREFTAAWPDGPVEVLPSLKANFSLALRRLLTREGLGCDTFSPGELRAALACGVPPALISVNGSSKSPELLRDAIVAGAHLTLDSLREARLVASIAREIRRDAVVRVRLRPDYGSLTAASEFSAEQASIADVTARYKPGIPHDDLVEAARLLREAEHVTVAGCHTHIGRHRPDLAMWEAMIPLFVDEIAAFAAAMGDGWRPRVIDVGGGFSPRRDPAGLSNLPSASSLDGAGSSPGHAVPEPSAAGAEPRLVPEVADYAGCIGVRLRGELARVGIPSTGVTLQLEPGRSLYANAGLHLATVTNTKEERPATSDSSPATVRTRRWVETDTSEAFLPDVNLEGTRWTVVAVARPEADPVQVADVVGVSCGFDVLVHDAFLPELAPGDLLAFLDTGAYQDAGSYNFNAMPRPATVLVHGHEAEIIKRAETVDDVFGRDVVPARLDPPRGLGAAAGFDHVGLAVADLERSLGFYRDRLGLALLGTGVESNARYAEMLGVERVRFAWAELDLSGGHVLELLRFDEPPSGVATGTGLNSMADPLPGPAPIDARPMQGGGPARLPGVAHVGIRVADIDAVHEALVAGGVPVVSRPIELVEENRWLGLRVFYAFDPDGHLVELIQEPAQAGRDA